MKACALLLPAVVALLPANSAAEDKAPASREPEPSSGIGLIVGGAVALGLGLANAATGSLYCAILSQTIYTSSDQGICWGVALGIGGVGVAVGVPLLIVGLNDHADHKEWERRNGLAGFSIAPLRSGAAVSWRLEF